VGLKKFERATMTRIGRYQIKSRQLYWQCFLPARQSRPAQNSPKLKQRLYPNAAWSTRLFWQRIGNEIKAAFGRAYFVNGTRAEIADSLLTVGLKIEINVIRVAELRAYRFPLRLGGLKNDGFWDSRRMNPDRAPIVPAYHR
jgi:hypothetical protein